jgi:iron-sulfur cluster assembly accessory protein
MSENQMIQFTDAAVTHLQAMVAKQNGLGLRISVKKTGCSGYMYVPEIVEQERAGDICWTTSQGLTVFLDPGCEAIVRGTVVDYVAKTLGVKQLEFKNPNAASLCGCGESFNLKEDATNE